MSEPITVFLSYLANDLEMVSRLRSDIKDAGFSPWTADEDLLPGQVWIEGVNEAMNHSDAFLFCLSNFSQHSDFVISEIQNAISLSKRRKDKVLIIPVFLEKFDLEAPATQVQVTFRELFRFKGVKLYEDYHGGLKKLIRALEVFSNRLKGTPLRGTQESSTSMQVLRNLQISEIELSNIRCFEKLTIGLKENGKPLQWAIILGDNALGKTTLLRSIALGLCNESDATVLMRSVPGGFVRQGSDEGYIKIKLSEVDIYETSTSSPLDERRQLSRALLNAFPTRSRLSRLLFYELDQNLEQITSHASLEEAVFQLIEWAEAEGRLNELVETARRQNPDNPSLREFNQQKRTREHTITTQIIKQSEDTEVVRQTIEPDTDFLWSDIFVCGYGVNRTTQTYANYEGYRSLDAIQSLFTSQPRFQDPEVVLLRRGLKVRKQLEHHLLNILMLDASEHQIHYTESGIELDGLWGRQLLQVLSDGYRSTTQWVLDFMGWLIQADRLTDNPDIGGILLIDEIEQHLHPRWQQHIVQRLQKRFPKTQIIASTHTPLTASGIADIESGVLLKLDQNDEGRIDVQAIDKKILDGKRADQVLASEAFGLLTSRNPGSQDDIDRYAALLGKPMRTDDEEAEFQALSSHLKEALSSGESKTAQIIEKAIDEELKRTLQNVSSDMIDIETKKQLRALFQSETSQ